MSSASSWCRPPATGRGSRHRPEPRRHLGGVDDGDGADLTAKGVEVAGPASPDESEDFLTAWVSDPDGNRIELVQWPAGHADGLSSADWVSTTSRHAGDKGRSDPDDAAASVQPTAADESPRVNERSAEAVVAELYQRLQAGDPAVLDDLV